MLAPLTHRGPIKASLVRFIPSPERLHNQSVNAISNNSKKGPFLYNRLLLHLVRNSSNRQGMTCRSGVLYPIVVGILRLD
jgi:hypothetical protein